MKLRSKLLLTVLLELGLTVIIIGLWAYRGSKHEIERLARDLLRARTEFAYALCERYNLRYRLPNAELHQIISSVRIASDGYIVAIDNSPGNKGTLIIHPTDAGANLNNDRFPHIQRILRRIDEAGQRDRFAAYDEYVQETGARGRQGESKIVYYMYYKPWNWILLSSAYERDLFQTRDIILHSTTEAIAGVAVLAIVILTFSIRRILAPLRQLTDTTNEVANGKLDSTFVNDSKDEIGELARSFNSMLRSLKHHLRIAQEFDIARRMQMQMLPAAPPDMPQFRIEARSMPAAEVGGDFYDFIKLNDRQLCLIVGDVSGKGVSGAMVMIAALSALRHAAEETSAPGRILEIANKRLALDLQKNMFVAAFCAVLDLKTGSFCYSNAGQPLPLLFRNGEASYLPSPADGDRFPLGIKHPICYGQHHFALHTGDLLALYTDGIVDMMNPAGEPYSFERFQTSLQRSAQVPLEKMLDHLVSEAEQFSGARERFDDVTLLVAKYAGVSLEDGNGAASVAPSSEQEQSIAEEKVIRLTLPSSFGFEKIAMDAAANLAEMNGMPQPRVEELRTAVSEACLNAMEHGNKLNAINRVDVVLKIDAAGLVVQVFDNGAGFEMQSLETPCLEKKIHGDESPRGLGLYLIERLVDEVEYKALPDLGHVTTLKMKLRNQ